MKVYREMNNLFVESKKFTNESSVGEEYLSYVREKSLAEKNSSRNVSSVRADFVGESLCGRSEVVCRNKFISSQNFVCSREPTSILSKHFCNFLLC